MRVFIAVKIHHPGSSDEDDAFGPMTTNDLDELLADLDVGYEHMLRAFRSLKANNFDD